jgi:pimeloyl-ACP methyl ester carboxylesterase
MILSAQAYGEGRPLILLPWFGLDHAVMAAACEPALAGTPWRRIYLDLPGTGKSAPVEPRTDAVADAVAETIDALAGRARVPLVGCSYGGYLAAELARRDPGRIAAILLVCSGVRIKPGERDLSGVLPAVPEPGWLDDVPEHLREYFERAIGFQTRAAADRVTAGFLANGPTDGQYLRALQSTGYQLSSERSLSALKVATTVIAGRRDAIVGYRDQFDLATEISTAGVSAAGIGAPEISTPEISTGAGRADGMAAADYVCLGDAGHFLPFEQPGRFKTLILDWLARCLPASEPY